ncbi:MAG: 16S rRNA (cytosine(1402)-N(4))-methyltransferase RsmH [Dokdonella sp.]|uniref:16S rRNA (cytosine(1402)-N(4))-methyltransferase RsmH n=1 Tax=Dokdonella sp. TaxID=2291710 RepID=UPI002B98538E|nr:16S rRNA (cytosine(1402)-N(4))-methyltransferase RsmH [Dokdonella sp.]HOX71087.1 16S rRNA (cytosine(1402)-N(4))-methyltransferase RsmH [Dokdonella sp.]HPN78957.1 16S rRNA (cytosine(1402)-N(4))-methyltransferase RsmH [Dokdonella sp.]
MAEAEFTHAPVMLGEVIEALQIQPEGIYLDGTFGRGGHAREVLQRLGSKGRLLLMDRDPAAIEQARKVFSADERVRIRHSNFAEMADWAETASGLDGVFLDLGVSSPQLDDARRGFSFQAEGPLDMRMDPGTGRSAAEWLAAASESEIADVLWRHGEERLSRRIARVIVERRAEQPLQTTTQLAELVARTIGHRERNKHPATRTFQALRIHLNDELGALEAGLDAALSRLKPGGRLVVISFHSLEDRVVKRFMRGQVSQPINRRNLPPVDAPPPVLDALGKRFASDAELRANPRSRSAVMRVAEKRA